MMRGFLDLRGLSALRLPGSDVPAASLPRRELYTALMALGVPGIDPTQGNQDLLFLYRDFLDREEAKAQGQRKPYSTQDAIIKEAQIAAAKAPPPVSSTMVGSWVDGGSHCHLPIGHKEAAAQFVASLPDDQRRRVNPRAPARSHASMRNADD